MVILSYYKVWLYDKMLKAAQGFNAITNNCCAKEICAAEKNAFEDAIKKLDELEAKETTVDGCYKCHCIRCGHSFACICPECGDGEEDESEN